MNAFLLLSCTGSVWAVKFHRLDKFLLYTITDQNIVFLVSDSCWVTVRNGNSISMDIREDTIKNDRTMLLSAIGAFWHCRRNTRYVHNRKISISFALSLCENSRKAHQRITCLPVSKAWTNNFYIYRQWKYIVYIYQYFPKCKLWDNKVIILSLHSKRTVSITKSYSK